MLVLVKWPCDSALFAAVKFFAVENRIDVKYNGGVGRGGFGGVT
jgi:hypothetical protein